MASSTVTVKLEGVAAVVGRLRAAEALARELDRSLALDESAARDVLAAALADYRAVAAEWRPAT